MSFSIKQGATSPAIRLQLQTVAGVAIDITGASSVTWTMTNRETGVTKIDAAAMTVIDADDVSGAIVEYAWQTGDTDTAGLYDGEVTVTYADASIEKFPDPAMVLVNIAASL